eukprot:403342181
MSKLKYEINKICADPFNKEDVKINDSYTYFNQKIFVKIFIYHVLFFTSLGPFTYPILRLFESHELLVNIGFYGCSRIYWYQVMQWAIFVVPLLIYILNEQISDQFPYTQIALVCISLVIRCLVISVRFATSLESNLKIQQTQILDRNQIVQEWISGAWMYIKPKQLENEIKFCMIRNEIENVFFKFKFFNKINVDYKNRWLNYNFVNEQNYSEKREIYMYNQFVKLVAQGQQQQTLKSQLGQSNKQVHPEDRQESIEASYLDTPTKEDLMTYYPGRQVLRELFMNCKHLAPHTIRKTDYIIAFIHAAMPLAVEYYFDKEEGDQKFISEKYNNPVYWLYTLPLIYLNLLYFRANLSFLQMAITDMKRRRLSMIVCETHLEANRHKVKDKYKATPLINFFDPRTLLSWIDARIMYLDLGKRFFIRLESYAQFFLIIYGCVGALWLGWFFELFEQYDIEIQIVYTLAYDIIVVTLQERRIWGEGMFQNYKQIDLGFKFD